MSYFAKAANVKRLDALILEFTETSQLSMIGMYGTTNAKILNVKNLT